MKLNPRFERAQSALLLALPLAFGACDTEEGQSGPLEVAVGDLQPAAEAAPPTAHYDAESEVGMLRSIHLGVFPNDENTTVDIFVNGEDVGPTLSFKEGTGYVELPAGSYTFDIVPSGGDIGDSILTIPNFTIAAGDTWEMVGAGYVSEEAKGARLTALAFPEDASDIPPGMARLNLFHTAALAALTPLDVWLVDDTCEPIESLIRDFEFGQVAARADLPTDPVMIGFDVDQDATVDACFEIPELEPGMMVNAFAVNNDFDEVSIVMHMPNGSTTELRPE